VEDRVRDGSPLIFKPFAKIRRLHFVFGADFVKRIWHKILLNKRTINASYYPPGPTTIADSLLPQCYKPLWDDLTREMSKLKHINLCADETTNISGKRIMNLSLLAPDRSYYLVTDGMEADAATIVSWFLKRVTELFGPPHNWTKINSFTSGTCNLMRSVWSGLSFTPGMEHIFTIPCDSHSLQLGIKDVLYLPL
jgi:Protein of unknown function (DUF 659)